MWMKGTARMRAGHKRVGTTGVATLREIMPCAGTKPWCQPGGIGSIRSGLLTMSWEMPGGAAAQTLTASRKSVKLTSDFNPSHISNVMSPSA